MAVSIHDVALRAGVSYTTVSKVLNDKPGDRTATQTRERVWEAAKELGYQPNAIARSLRQQRTDIIGWYTHLDDLQLNENWSSSILDGLRRGCDLYNKDLLIHRNFHGKSPEHIYRDLFSGKVDAIILPSSCQDEIVRRLITAKIPVVALADPHRGLPTVLVDSVGGFRVLAKYLSAKGHKRVLYRDEILGIVSPGRDGNRRVAAFQEAAVELGMEVILANGGYGPVSKEEADLLLGPTSGRPTAVVCYNDAMAHETMRFCQKMGIRVPDDLAVAGFDGFETPYAWPYELTTIIAPWSDCAAKAVDLVMGMAEGMEPPAETVLPVTLKLGTTT